MFSAHLKRGSLELLVLSVLVGESRHGYEIGKRLEALSDGQVQLKVSTLYSVLYRMEGRGWIRGRWVENKGQRRRCYYTLTPDGSAALEAQKKEWRAFAAVVNKVVGLETA